MGKDICLIGSHDRMSDITDALEKLAKKHGGVCTGGGTDLSNMLRDVSFHFKSAVNARKFREQAVKTYKVKTVTWR